MQKVFVMYNLRPGVSLEDYRKWSREVDQRITPSQEGCIRFEVYAIEGSESGGQAPYQIVEDIEVESWDVWRETLNSKGMAVVAEGFPQYADEASVQLIYGSRVH